MNKLIFVCMGNICRSPAAEGLMQHRLEADPLGAQWQVDSAGTHHWHLGRPPDHRSIAAMSRLGVDISGLRARALQPEDFAEGSVLLVMDHHNRDSAEQQRPVDAPAPLELLMPFADGLGLDELDDPYYGDDAGFDRMAKHLQAAMDGVLNALRAGRWS